jgi:tRNA nucleotidyltransferase (CCA-adding enzyme)
MQIEITTMRRDEGYSDRRRPDRVIFTGDITEDLSRRDFTVNAMAFSPEEGLIDPFGGRQDLVSGSLRCVGEPERRFSEDALRILRLFRFASQLSFSPDPASLAAAGRCRGLLRAVSRERVQAELNRILTGPGVCDALRLICDEGVLTEILPEFAPCIGFEQRSPYHDRTVDRHIFSAVSYAPPRLEICLALLLHDIGKPAAFTLDENGRGHTKGHAAISRDMAEGILKRLRYPARTTSYVLRLIELHSRKIPAERPALRRLLAGPGPEFVRDMLDLKEADDRAKADVARLKRYPAIRAALDGIIRDGDCLSVADLKVNGEDVKALGVPPGPMVGRLLARLLDLVLEDPDRNDRGFLLKKAKELL